MTTTMNRDLVLAVLTHLGNGRTVAWTGNACKLMPRQVVDIATEHGALRAGGQVDKAAAALAAAHLRAEASAPPAPAQPAARSPLAEAPRSRPTAPAPVSSGDMLSEVAIVALRPDPDNPRADVGDVTELAASLRTVGLLQPIVARRAPGGQLVVVAGHRRLAAARLAGWTHVQVIVRREMRPDDVLAAMLVENSHRKDLDPIEEARGYARLRAQLGTGDSGVARRVGRQQTHIAARLLLLDLPIEEQEALRRGEMSLGEAVDRARLASGRLRGAVPRGLPHLGPRHPLAQRAKARCIQSRHSRGRGQGVGGIACGECWESVIRADERRTLHARSGRTGACALCDAPVGPPDETTDGGVTP